MVKNHKAPQRALPYLPRLILPTFSEPRFLDLLFLLPSRVSTCQRKEGGGREEEKEGGPTSIPFFLLSFSKESEISPYLFIHTRSFQFVYIYLESKFNVWINRNLTRIIGIDHWARFYINQMLNMSIKVIWNKYKKMA